MQTPRKTLVTISWDGQHDPLSCVLVDAVPDFEILLFDYSGSKESGTTFNAKGLRVELLSCATECKGDIFQAVGSYLSASQACHEYVGLIDDDIVISISDINRALHLARVRQLDVFSPVLTHDSNYSHSWMLQQPHRAVREVEWVEVMMPFYRGEVFLAARPFAQGFVSSWGFDAYLFPMIQKMLGMTRCGLIDAVAASHFRPVSSHDKIFKSGMNAFEEAAAVKRLCMEYIQSRYPDWLDSDWFDRIYIRKRIYTRWQHYVYQLGRPIKRWLEKSA